MHGVRALALENRHHVVGTAERLRALEAEGRIDPALARDDPKVQQVVVVEGGHQLRFYQSFSDVLST